MQVKYVYNCETPNRQNFTSQRLLQKANWDFQKYPTPTSAISSLPKGSSQDEIRDQNLTWQSVIRRTTWKTLGKGGTPYTGLHNEAPPDMGQFFHLQGRER